MAEQEKEQTEQQGKSFNQAEYEAGKMLAQICDGARLVESDLNTARQIVSLQAGLINQLKESKLDGVKFKKLAKQLIDELNEKVKLT